MASPDGTQFSTPIQFTWADEYNGELGNLAVEYYQNGAWGTDVANAAYNDVILSNGTYTMSTLSLLRVPCRIERRLRRG